MSDKPENSGKPDQPEGREGWREVPSVLLSAFDGIVDEVAQARPELIWIQDAQTEYGVSRGWLDKQVAAGALSFYDPPSKKRRYLFRAELDRLLRPSVLLKQNKAAAGAEAVDGEDKVG